MRSRGFPVTRRLSGCAFVLICGCRGDRDVTATDIARQFYTMREAIGGTGAPLPRELAALRPFITDSLARGLARADSLRRHDIELAGDEKPRFADGDLYSSLFEGVTSFRAMPALANSEPVLVPVELINDRQRPVVHWIDTVVVAQHDGRWRVQDIRYGGLWAFGNKGSLLRELFPSP